jgi:hypothetical protein
MQSDSRRASATCEEVVVDKPQPKKAAAALAKKSAPAKKAAPAPTTEAAMPKKAAPAKKAAPRPKGTGKKA